MENYFVQIGIDITAESPQDAARQAWAILTSPEEQLADVSTVTVREESGFEHDIHPKEL